MVMKCMKTLETVIRIMVRSGTITLPFLMKGSSEDI
jgi:hypothetical protein